MHLYGGSKRPNGTQVHWSSAASREKVGEPKDRNRTGTRVRSRFRGGQVFITEFHNEEVRPDYR